MDCFDLKELKRTNLGLKKVDINRKIHSKFSSMTY